MTARLFGILSLLFLCMGCDDGDTIVTTFDFDEGTVLKTCQNQQTIVVYTINTEPNESIAFSFRPEGATNETSISLDEYASIKTIERTANIEIPLNENNQLVYRLFNSEVEGNYFCSSIPPSQPLVNEQYISTNGGSVHMNITAIEEGEDRDSDSDGIIDIQEIENPEDDYRTVDTDGDGIPNYLDIDDDNDNVLTTTERAIENTPIDENDYPDTDEDGIPNYLDPDDDDDGILTRNEDLNAYDEQNTDGNLILNPTDDDTNGDGIPNYLDPETAMEVNPLIEQSLPNTIDRSFKVVLVARNITMKNSNSDEAISVETLQLGSYTFSSQVTIEPTGEGGE